MPVSYDPRDFGALCDRCPLGPRGPQEVRGGGAWAPVLGEHYANAKLLAVGEAPGLQEVQQGRPFVPDAPSGKEWERTLAHYCLSREDASLTNVIKCRPLGNNYRQMERRLKAVNRDREVDSAARTWAHPEECCRPLLRAELRGYDHVLALGAVAARAVLAGERQGIFALRGGPREVELDGHVIQVMPTFHPAYICRTPRWREVFLADVGKALRWFDGFLGWSEPWILHDPSPEELEAFYAQPAAWWSYDLETDGIEPLRAALRCLAVATPDFNGPCWHCRGTGGRCPVCHGEGHGIASRAVLIPALSGDGREWRCAHDWRQVVEVQARAFTDGRLWIGHNANYYDRMMVERYFGVTPRPLVDTIILARLWRPELPKALGVVGSVLTDVHAWKADNEGRKLAVDDVPDRERDAYCVTDAVVPARMFEQLVREVEERHQTIPLRSDLKPAEWPPHLPWSLVGIDHFAQELCVGLHKVGMAVDQTIREAHVQRLSGDIRRLRAACVEVAHRYGVHGPVKRKSTGPEPFNPASHHQMRRLLFDVWGLPPKGYTQSGEPSTADAVLRSYIGDTCLSREIREFLRDVRWYRQALKDLGAFVLPLAPEDVDVRNALYQAAGIWIHGEAWFREDEEEDRQLAWWTRGVETPQQDYRAGMVWADGRVHADWNAHGTSVDRLSSSRPNLQNVPHTQRRNYRTQYRAAPGRVLVGADLDQVHLRIIANIWRIPRLLQCFRDGDDPHCLLALDYYGDSFRNADGWGPEGFSLKRKPAKGSVAERIRGVCKTGRYAGAYGAHWETIHETLTRTEDEKGRLIYADMEKRETQAFYETWMRVEPEWQQAWEAEEAAYRQRGYAEDPLFGRRCDFADTEAVRPGARLNDVINFPVLAAESCLMRIAEARVLARVPFDYAGPGTGVVNQCHDSLVVECPESHAERVAAILEDAMHIEVPGWEVPITASAEIGRTWSEV